MNIDKPIMWSQTTIGSLCDLINGRAFKPKEWSEDGLPIIRIQNLNNPAAKYNHFDGELADKHRVEKGVLLFAWSGTPGTSFGAHIWNGGTAALNQHIFKIEFIEELINKLFLRYAINQTLDELITGAHGGVGLRHVTKGKFEATEITFPSFTEQKVIADKLDTLLAQVETTKARLERIPQILKRFRQSVLAAAVSGKLTEEWREINHEIDTTWKKVSFSKIILKLRSGAADRPNEDSKGIPILRSSAIRPLEIDFSDIRYLENVSTLKEDNYLKQGDLLFTRLSGSAEYVGNCAMVKSVDRQYQYPDRLFCARLKEPRYGRYLEYFFASQNFRGHIQNSLKSSAGHQRITLDVIKTAVVVLPPLEEQTEIVRRVEQLFAHVDTIEQQVNKALAKVNNLTQSILAKAFRGELTEQWRRDNPELISGENSAEALLARIQAERAVAAKPVRRKTKT